MKHFLKKVLPGKFINSAKTLAGEQGPNVKNAKVKAVPRYSELVLPCYISSNKYGSYCVPGSSYHRPAAQAILSGKVWEPETIEFIIKHVGKGDIVHAGTYFGDFVPALSGACTDGAKLWAFEPNSENFRCALITVAINQLTNVEITNAGLGDINDSGTMVVSDKSGRALGGASRLVAKEQQSNPESMEEVMVMKLDDKMPTERHVSIIQLDVEGFEMEALSGAMETIKRCQPIIILEDLPEADWITENILDLGYRISGKLHINTVFSPDN